MTSTYSLETMFTIFFLFNRKVDPLTISNIESVKQLRAERNKHIYDGDAQKKIKNSHSKQIGTIMGKMRSIDDQTEKKNLENQINDLKLEVEKANQISLESDKSLQVIDTKINEIVSCIPNLLDQR